MNLQTQLGHLTLKNPILLASGTSGYGEELQDFYPVESLGALCTKGLSLKPRQGNPMPRMVETPSGMINAIGLQNVGVEAFINNKLPPLEKQGVTVLANIFGNTLEEYVQVAEFLQKTSVAGIELNISCPNVKAGGMEFGNDPKAAAKVTAAVRQVFDRHLMVKLSPNVTDIVQVALSVEAAGADSLSLINTLTALAIDVHTRRPRIANGLGGLSGPAIRPIAVRMVAQVFKAVKIPLVGIGGITCLSDVLEFLIAGASAVQIGTATFINPQVAAELLQALKNYLTEKSVSSVKDLVGTLEW